MSPEDYETALRDAAEWMGMDDATVERLLVEAAEDDASESTI